MQMEKDDAAQSGGKLPFTERLRLMRSRRYDEWWPIVFLGPAGTLLAAAVSEVRWITPNLVTWFGFVIRLVACWLLYEASWTSDIIAIALIQFAGMTDAVDGCLARYRNMSSYEGAFLDKIADAIIFVAVVLTLGYRSFLETQDVLPLFAAMLIGTTFTMRIRIYWLVRFFELEHAGGKLPKQQPLGWGDMNFMTRLRYYVSQTHMLFAVQMADVYLALSIGILVGQLEWTLYILCIVTSIWFFIILVTRWTHVRRLDRTAPGLTGEHHRPYSQ